MRLIDVVIPGGHVETVLSLASERCLDHWVDAETTEERQTVHLLVDAENLRKCWMACRAY